MQQQHHYRALQECQKLLTAGVTQTSQASPNRKVKTVHARRDDWADDSRLEKSSLNQGVSKEHRVTLAFKQEEQLFWQTT